MPALVRHPSMKRVTTWTIALGARRPHARVLARERVAASDQRTSTSSCSREPTQR